MSEEFEKFEALRKKSAEYYSALKPVKCPALGEDVHFTSDGFHHLRYDGSRCERSKKEQIIKLKLLRRAVELIGKSTTIQEYRRCVMPVGKVRQDGFRKTSEAQYWGFVGVVDEGCRLRAIVRRVGDGQMHFWSVMADWWECDIIPGQKIKRMAPKDIAEI